MRKTLQLCMQDLVVYSQTLVEAGASPVWGCPWNAKISIERAYEYKLTTEYRVERSVV